jgi:hypothetical protein
MNFKQLIDNLAANPVALACSSFALTAVLILRDGVTLF